TVWLAPDASLSCLPWAALPGSKPGSVLLEDHALAVVPHGQMLLEGLQAKSRVCAEDGTLLLLGNVAYDQPPAQPGIGPTPLGPTEGESPPLRPAPLEKLVHWPVLPAAGQEMACVAALAGKRTVQSLKGNEANTDRLLEELPRARWAHLATHGFFAHA